MKKATISSQQTSWQRIDNIALCLRLGVGAVFVIGGYSKLSQLLDPTRSQAMVDQYMGPAGYINSFFSDYLFNGMLSGIISPWGFLTALSSFELISGLALLVGFLVGPLALVYGFLLWTFVFSLPVVTTPGVEVTVKTYTSPALLVQIRDVALSGFMFVLFNLGSGRFSIDAMRSKSRVRPEPVSWDAFALLTRLSLAVPFLVGGFFAGMSNIQSFSAYPLLLIVIGLLLVAGIGIRVVAIAVALTMFWFMLGKFSVDKTLIANLNGFKREFAMLAASLVLFVYGGGNKFVWYRFGDKRSGEPATT
ncbi:MAG: DoxX family protein [Granulosicoccus sp.]